VGKEEVGRHARASLRAVIGAAGGAASGRTRKWMRHCTDGLQPASLSAASRLAKGLSMLMTVDEPHAPLAST
jgi:hypothetical protein